MRKFWIPLIISILLVVLLIFFLVNSNSWSYKSEQAEKAAIYLENYYSSYGEYPSSEEFYESFPSVLIYREGPYLEPSYTLEYKTQKVYGGAYGTPYHFNELFESHIRYYISSCDTARRCTWLDFEERNSPKGVQFSQVVMHNKSEPYYYVHPYFLGLKENDSKLMSMLIPHDGPTSRFVEAEEGETDKYLNFNYDSSFFYVNNFSQPGYADPTEMFKITEFVKTGKIGKTFVSYEIVHCENISTNDCDNFSKKVTLPIEIYERK